MLASSKQVCERTKSPGLTQKTPMIENGSVKRFDVLVRHLLYIWVQCRGPGIPRLLPLVRACGWTCIRRLIVFASSCAAGLLVLCLHRKC
jgi:hypothetical protein